MTRRMLWGIVSLLAVTNVLTLFFWLGEREMIPVTPKVQETDMVEADDSLEPVALINGKEISYIDWISSLKNTYGEKTLEEMVNKQLVFQLADEHDVKIEEKLVDRELNAMKTMQGLVDEKYIKENQKKWKEDILYQLYLEEILTSDIEIPEEEIKDYYKEHEDDFDFVETYQLSQIIVNNKTTADKIIKELEGGSDFSMLAREYSYDKATKGQGGYLGYFSKESTFLQDAYFETAAGLEGGQYSKPFQADGGYAIIYLHRTLPQVSFTYEELKSHIRRELALNHVGEVASANALWEQADINWIYGK